MNAKKYILFFTLFFLVKLSILSQHITNPIHYSKWVQNFQENTTGNYSSFTSIPMVFYMDKADGKVEQYEKLEIGIQLPEIINIKIANFIRSGNGINPFDPDQIKIEATFRHFENLPKNNYYAHFISKDCIKITDAFYYEEFHHEMNDERFSHGYWKQDTLSYNFRIRFAPRLIGWWSCAITIYINNQIKYTLQPFEFLCTEGKTDGFINSVSDDHRLLQFENGKNFFGIGQNIPIADMPDPIMPYDISHIRVQPPQGFVLQREYIADLAKNRGNLVRIMHGEWADAIEWEKLGDYSMNMEFAWEFDQTINLCRDSSVYILWLQQVHTAFMPHNPFGNDDLAWPLNPYHISLHLEKPEQFFTDSVALKFYKQKIRYMLSRWGYSRMIAGIQPMSEINEMAAYGLDHPYFKDTTFRNQVGKWFLEIKDYIQKDLGYDFLVGSSFTGDVGANVNDDPVMRYADFNDYHPYGQNRNRNIGNRFGGINITPGYGIFKRYKKPVIIGEMGTWDTEYLHQCHENEFHNDIWGTAFIGGWGTGIHWHNWEDNLNLNLRSNFIGISKFLSIVDFTNTKWIPSRWPYKHVYDSTYSEKRNDYFEVLFLKEKKKAFRSEKVVGWVHNRSAYWYNYPETECEKELTNKKTNNVKGKKYFRPDDDDVNGFVKYEGEENKEKRVFKVAKIRNLKGYDIYWFNTLTGECIKKDRKFHWLGKMKVSIPDEINDQQYQDLGFMIMKKIKSKPNKPGTKF